jgi:hypothetical protein
MANADTLLFSEYMGGGVSLSNLDLKSGSI